MKKVSRGTRITPTIINTQPAVIVLKDESKPLVYLSHKFIRLGGDYCECLKIRAVRTIP
jgi:hypothetical protein